jgi:RHS repeat-associated protein
MLSRGPKACTSAGRFAHRVTTPTVDAVVDPESGLIYLRARWYDPATGQFLSVDPLEGETGDAYSYAGDNPTNNTDPTGLCFVFSCSTWDSIADASAGFGDTVTLGLTKDVREWINGDPGVNYCDPAYGAGGLGALALTWEIPGEDDAEAARLAGERQALRDLVNEVTNGGRTPLSPEDAETVGDWAKEVGYPGARATPGDVADPSNWNANPVPHVHIPGAGRGGHVPVEPGTAPW